MDNSSTEHDIRCIAAEGEGQRIEFKEALSNLDRELVGMANAIGGSIYIGIADDGEVSGFQMGNKKRSEIQTIARNCDPPIPIQIIQHGDVVEVAVNEGEDKPYRCRGGFFLRQGANTQKLRRDEIRDLVSACGRFHYDASLCHAFRYPEDFSQQRFLKFLQAANIQHQATPEDILRSLDLAVPTDDRLALTHAAVLLFAEAPQHWLRESHISCVCYQGTDRLTIIDRQEIHGDLLSMIDQALIFLKRHIEVRYEIGAAGQREERHAYPLPVLREALINAVTHRDYYYDGSHTYVHIFSDRMEIENPGGLYGGLTVEDLGRRSVRRNSMIADLMYRAGYVEQVGSGIPRMREMLSRNGNPPFELSSTNFFTLRLYPAPRSSQAADLTERQRHILRLIEAHRPVAKRKLAELLGVSDDTILRDLQDLLRRGLVDRSGIGRATRYL